MGLFMLMLDSTVVTLALPAIRRELGASPSELQWVVNAYLLTVAVFVVTAGRLGDMVGRKRVFLVALAIFSGGLVVAALAPSIEVLVVARVIQGVGAAGMLTLSLALVSSAFSDADRPRALGIWAGVSALALAIGPLVGGVLVDQLSWRWVFWIGVPPLALGFLWTARATRETRDEAAGRHLDVPGVVTLTLGLGLIVLALVQGDDWGWSSARTLVVLALGILAAIAFVVIDEHVKSPIVEFDLFRNRPYLGATAAAFCLVGAWWAVIFYMPQYLQDILGYSAVASGVLVLPITAPMVVISPLCERLIARVGAKVLMTAGMLCATVGVLIMTRIDATSGYALLLPGFLLFGVALGLVYTPMSTAAMAAMPRSKAGIAAGVLAMNRLLAGSVLLAATGALFAAFGHERDGAPLDVHYTYALSHALWATVALLAVGTVLTAWLVEGRATPTPAPDGGPQPSTASGTMANRSTSTSP
ncbi:MFS transporter [Capillimicrobium parvum]|uniref:Multidrug resistance protein Stp n=1 Tax=Capillimicrobium parvum TaxID=2884022 RepID=A0A9E6XU52_9ACTN|nr:MFS transporter [Capillimicrobium parvum]UGS33801.1 Multidrug resistance protein Stp [Capillimicrobium parvum]